MAQCPECSTYDWSDVIRDARLRNEPTPDHHPNCATPQPGQIFKQTTPPGEKPAWWNTPAITVKVHGSLIHESQLRQVIRESIWQATRISVSLHTNITTGEAVSILLDALKWPKAKRSIARGVTMLSYWSVDNQSAFNALKQLIEAEGPSASFYENENGYLVFATGE